MIDVLIHSMVGILSQYVCISNHYVLHLKHITILLVNYTSVNLKK